MPEDLAAIADVLDLLEMRAGLETEMAALAAERRDEADLAALRRSLADMDASDDTDQSMRIDRAFHVTLATATRNGYYVRFTEFLGLRLVPSRRLYLVGEGPMTPQAYAQLINADHRAIYDAVAAGDPDAARAAARAHMRSSIARYRALRDQARDEDAG